MAYTAGFNIGPRMTGIDLSLVGTTQLHPMGSIAYDNRGRKYVYVKANGTVAAFKLVKSASASDPFTNVVIATASGAATKVLGMTVLALAANQYAWIVTQGVVEDDASVVSASVANGDPLISDGSGNCTLATAADLEDTIGICIVDDTDNTGTIVLSC